MIANYHTHTWRCLHASGTEREYVENAIAGGLKILGFSDHAPMPYADGYVSRARMQMNQLEEYVDTILRLKAEYKKEIEIHLGLEVEYYPRYFDALLGITGQYPFEYFLLAQHYLGNEWNDHDVREKTSEEQRLIRYCLQCMKAMETGCFTYFAHPDLLHYTGNVERYEQWMGRLCSYARCLDIPLEINFSGIRNRDHYPDSRFWKIAGKIGNTVIFGADAHQPNEVWEPESQCRAEVLVREYHLRLMDMVTCCSPKKNLRHGMN